MSLIYLPLFVFSMIIGTVITLSSSNWTTMWVGLEINLMSFIPIIMMEKHNQFIDAAIKYFIVQAVGSTLLLLSILIHPPLLIFPLLIKLGAAPTHFWVPAVFSSSSWPMIALLSSWQKIAPLAIMTACTTSTQSCMFISIGMISAWLGALLALNQSKIKSIIAYSSIANTGWMIALTPWQTSMFMFFLLYCVILIPLLIIFYQLNIDTPNFKGMSIKHKTMAVFLILTLAAIPPTPGFLAKWVAIPNLIFTNPPTRALILVMSSVPLILMYLSVLFSILLSPTIKDSKSNWCLTFLAPLPLCGLIWLFSMLSPEPLFFDK